MKSIVQTGGSEEEVRAVKDQEDGVRFGERERCNGPGNGRCETLKIRRREE